MRSSAVARSARPRGVLRSSVGRDQADATGAGDREGRAGALRWAPAARARVPRSRPARLVEATPDLTLAELQTEPQQRCGLQAGLSTSTRRSGGSACGIKKSLRAVEQDRPDVAGKRRLWRAGSTSSIRRGSSFSTRQTPPPTWPALWPQPFGSASGCGRAAWPLAHHDLHRWAQAKRHRRTAGAGRADDGVAFRAYVEQFLAPALEPGDVVVLDNLAAHGVDGVRQAIAAAGASLLYLPPTAPI